MDDDAPMYTSRWRSLAPVVDRAIPWLVGLFLGLVILDPELSSPGWQTPALIVFAAVQAGALWWRRTHPVHVMAVVTAAGLGFHLLAPATVIPVAVWFALGALAVARPPRVSLVGLVAATGVSAAGFISQPIEDPVFAMIVGVAVWGMGEAIRGKTLATRQEALQAIGEERAHLAREIHDVLAHSVSVIVVQAAAADDVFDEHPDKARDALRAIERHGRDALVELRRLLKDGGDGEPLAPQPGLSAIDDLATELRATGLDVVVARDGGPRTLPAGLDLSAFRIVQEATTNTLRHADATRIEITVGYRDDGVELHVRDDGRSRHAPGSTGGRGLVGMRERARLHGGRFEAGPIPDGGYAVSAWLPDGGTT